jgi:hypothetical protein
MHQIRKIKTILSKSVYVEVFRKMDGHNGMLRTLIEQSIYRNATQQKPRSDAIQTVQRYKTIRKVVSSIYKTVIQEKFWRCPCRNVHTIRFVLDQKVNGCDEVEKVRFRMVFTAPASGSMIATISKWHEVAVEPAQIQSASQQGFSQPSIPTGSSLCMDPSHQISPSQISDMCNALARYVTSPDNQKPLGYLSDGSYRHDLFVLRSDEGMLDSQSLEDLLRESSQFLPSVDGGFDFSRRDRLYLAAKLASTVIQFQGNWLPESWGSGDISISKNAASLAEAIRCPFLTRKLVNTEAVERSLRSSQVCNETLLQLGLALIELSLCRHISLRQNPQEAAGDKIAGLLLTANRCLESVYGQSGMRYCNVVNQCLVWARTKHMEVESDEFQAAVLENVVKPLVKDLTCFDSPA